jgi:hypothetical protein
MPVDPLAPPLSSLLTELGSRRRVLDAQDTEIGKAIQGIEQALRQHINTRVIHQIPNGRRIGFGKCDGTWCLLVETDHGSDGYEDRPLTSCPRDVRAEMFIDGHIEELIRSAVGQIDAQITERETALASAAALLEALS